MLWQHSALYLLARGVPGLISLLAIVAYTRLLAPEQYGRYALVIAGVGLANKLAFEWLRLALLRFLPTSAEPRILFATIGAAFVSLVVLSAVVGAGVLLFVDASVRGLVGMGLALLWVQALFELELERARSELAPKRYGLMALARAALGLALGVALVAMGLGAAGPVLGLLVAMLVALVPPLLQILPGFRLALWDPVVMREHVRYGAPLAMTLGLGFIIANSDRFMIGWLLNEASVGRYAASYDLASFAIGLLLMIVNLAAYPLAVRALEAHGPQAVRVQLRANLTALLGLGLPATVGLVVLARPMAEALLGTGFRDQAAVVIPLIAFAAFLRDLKAYHLDLAFQLGRRTWGQMWVAVTTASLNIVLNLWWIPAHGIVGAAWATVVAQLLALALSALLGRRVFALPRPSADDLKVALAALGMAGVLWWLGDSEGFLGLATRVVLSATAYGGLLWLLDTGGIRAHVAAWARLSTPAGGRE